VDTLGKAHAPSRSAARTSHATRNTTREVHQHEVHHHGSSSARRERSKNPNMRPANDPIFSPQKPISDPRISAISASIRDSGVGSNVHEDIEDEFGSVYYHAYEGSSAESFEEEVVSVEFKIVCEFFFESEIEILEQKQMVTN